MDGHLQIGRDGLSLLDIHRYSDIGVSHARTSLESVG